MKETLEFLVKQLVKNKKDVCVAETDEGDYLNLRLSVKKDDMGVVIGKGGKIIKALRNILRIKALKENKKINIELNEVESAGAAATPPQKG